MKNLGYLCSEYPALSHTFISREIHILEKEGFKIETVSVNKTKNLEKMSPEDKIQAAKTYVLKNTPFLVILGALLKSFLIFPRFLKVFFFTYSLSIHSGPKDPVKALGYFIQAILLHRWARKNNISHIHVHFANPAATVALIATKFGGLEFSLSVHGPDEFYDVQRNNLREKIESAVFIRCIGFYCRSQLMRLSPLRHWNKFHIVRCGLYKNEFAPRSPLTGPGRKILCVGRLCPSKGQAILIEASSILKKRNLDFQVLFLGGGEDQKALEELVVSLDLQSCVTLAGPVGHQRVKDELIQTDLFVLPSFAEGIPVALMEAMAAGVPVVSTNITGIPELIENGRTGHLTEASHAESLADVLELYIQGKIDLSQQIPLAVQTIATRYDVETNTRNLGKIFRENVK